ncbi:MAG: iron-containing alcohol dehydrogenase [Chloroflexi bacterium]|nr:iron-containing alcohol dehydrogenase [Chloroflexota bacterium]MCL5110865.1 iron-containing alcohol dehydrogenase [Chloroflexota bacterium]
MVLPTQVLPFRLPATIYFGIDAVNKVADEAVRCQAKRPVIICDPGVAKAGLAAQIQGILSKASLTAEVYDQVEPEPTVASLDRCVEWVRQGGFDLLVGVGGGSAMDTTKGVSVLLKNGGSIRDYFGIDKVPQRGLPYILVATTAGTGAEISNNAVFLDVEQKLKVGTVSPHCLADVAIVDPLLTVSMPPSVTAATGMDALTHAIESYTAVKATPLTELWSLESIRLIAKSLRTAVCRGGDLQARYDMALGSLDAGIALANASAGSVHALAYPLGGTYRVAHGVSNAMMMPYVLEYNYLADIPKFAKVAEAMGECLDGLCPREAAYKAVEAVRKLSQDVGIPQRMRDVGVPDSAVEAFVPGAMATARLMDNNPRRLTEKEVLDIYRRAW